MPVLFLSGSTPNAPTLKYKNCKITWIFWKTICEIAPIAKRLKSEDKEMKIEKIKVDEIIPYADNAKLHPERQIEQIRSSILEFGFNDPIAIDENIDRGVKKWQKK